MPRQPNSVGFVLATICLVCFVRASAARKVQPQGGTQQQTPRKPKASSGNFTRLLSNDSDGNQVIEVSAAGALLCYVDTAEYFAQAWSVPSEHQGTPMSCYSYGCTDGHACSSAFSHGWETSEACESRKHNAAFENVECCHGVGCNRPADSSTWTYIGPSSTAEGNLACYTNDLPDCTDLYQPIPGCKDKAVKVKSAYSVIYGHWSANPSNTNPPYSKGYACVRYQLLDHYTGSKLAGWIYTVVEQASCDLDGRIGKLGSSFSKVVDISSSLCCTEDDCNAPDPSVDELTMAGPRMAAAVLGLESTFAAESNSVTEAVKEDEHLYSEAIATAGPKRHLSGMNAPAGDDATTTFIRQPLSMPSEYSDSTATPDLTQSMVAADNYVPGGTKMNMTASNLER